MAEKAVEALREAFSRIDEVEAKRVAGELPDIPPVREGESMAIFVPRRKGRKSPGEPKRS